MLLMITLTQQYINIVIIIPKNCKQIGNCIPIRDFINQFVHSKIRYIYLYLSIHCWYR